MTYVFIISL